MAMMAYRATMFMVFFNYAMVIAKFIGNIIFPNTQFLGTKVIPGMTGTSLETQGTSIFSNIATTLGVSDLSSLALTAGVLALFAFSLLIPTIPFVFAFFTLSGIITDYYIAQLPLDWVFKTPIIVGASIIYYVGISQYAARSTFQGS